MLKTIFFWTIATQSALLTKKCLSELSKMFLGVDKDFWNGMCFLKSFFVIFLKPWTNYCWTFGDEFSSWLWKLHSRCPGFFPKKRTFWNSFSFHFFKARNNTFALESLLAGFLKTNFTWPEQKSARNMFFFETLIISEAFSGFWAKSIGFWQTLLNRFVKSRSACPENVFKIIFWKRF